MGFLGKLVRRVLRKKSGFYDVSQFQEALSKCKGKDGNNNNNDDDDGCPMLVGTLTRRSVAPRRTAVSAFGNDNGTGTLNSRDRYNDCCDTLLAGTASPNSSSGYGTVTQTASESIPVPRMAKRRLSTATTSSSGMSGEYLGAGVWISSEVVTNSKSRRHQKREISSSTARFAPPTKGGVHRRGTVVAVERPRCDAQRTMSEGSGGRGRWYETSFISAGGSPSADYSLSSYDGDTSAYACIPTTKLTATRTPPAAPPPKSRSDATPQLINNNDWPLTPVNDSTMPSPFEMWIRTPANGWFHRGESRRGEVRRTRSEKNNRPVEEFRFSAADSYKIRPLPRRLHCMEPGFIRSTPDIAARASTINLVSPVYVANLSETDDNATKYCHCCGTNWPAYERKVGRSLKMFLQE